MVRFAQAASRRRARNAALRAPSGRPVDGGRSPLDQNRPETARPLALAHDAEAFGDLGVGLQQAAEIAAEAVLIELLVRLDVPQPAGIGGQLVRHHDPHEVILPQPPGLHLEVDETDADAEKQPGEEIVDADGEAMMSSISCGVAQPNAVMCSSETIGSPS